MTLCSATPTRMTDATINDSPGSGTHHHRLARGLRRWMTCGLAVGLSGAMLVPAMAAGQILKWSGFEKDPHPCLYITARDLPRLKQSRQDMAAISTQKSWGLEENGLDNLVAASLIAGNTNAERVVIAEALKRMDELISKIPSTTKDRVGPHAYGRVFGRAVGLADAALAGKLITPEERGTLLSRIAQASYMINDPGYWNPETGKCNLCPNMTTSAYGYRVTLAALIPSHPLSKQWLDTASKEIKREIYEWADVNGGMLECPHYSMVILDQWLGACIAARNAGAADSGNLFDPQLRKAIEWFGNISTPRDPRNGGFRRFPTLGHTYVNERTSTFGLMAYLWKDKDPEFAARMQWMHLENGAFSEPGVLSYYPGIMGYRSLLGDVAIKPKVPAWGSACYPETGVLLRNMIGSDRETTLYMIAGRNHSHYFNDSGSITLWGKGRELCDDDSYQFQRSKDSRAAHSMPDKPATFNEERVMALQEFSASPQFDYVRGIRRGWQRQIAFVKDADPLGPNYFVIADTLDAKSAPTTWRLFLAAAQIVPSASGVTVVGRDDVDMDVVFLRPASLKTVTETNQIHVALAVSGTLSAVLYPRLKTEKPPKITPLADGRGVKVVTPAGTDYVFLNPESFAFTEGDVAFEGKVGLIKIRGGKQIKSMPGACDVAPGWEGGDRELRTIRWKGGPEYPISPDE